MAGCECGLSSSDLTVFKKGVSLISTAIVVYIILSVIFGAVIGAGVFERVRRRMTGVKQAEAEDLAKQVVQNAQREAENILKEARFEAKDLVFKAKSGFEEEQKAKLGELSVMENVFSNEKEGLTESLPLWKSGTMTPASARRISQNEKKVWRSKSLPASRLSANIATRWSGSPG